MNSMPSLIVGPVALIEPPLAFTPFTVSNSRSVSKSQITLPSAIAYARKCPSIDPEKTTPGIAVAGAICDGLHPRAVPQAGGGGGVNQAFSPLTIFNANIPPPGKEPSVCLMAVDQSDRGTYINLSSAAAPHMMPPSAPPFPSRTAQTISPCLSGSSACTTPDF